MPESPSSSFIPKRGVGKKPAVARKGNFVLLSIVSYALFVSAPLASAAVFIYERHTQNLFNKAVVNLDEAIQDFKEEDLARVTEFDEQLAISSNLLSSHVSLVTLLQTIEAATAQTVTFKDLEIVRTSQNLLDVSGLLATDELNGALFQRSSYNAVTSINSPLFSDVVLVPPGANEAGGGDTSQGNVEFQVTFSVASEDVLYKPLAQTESSQTIETETAIPVDTTDSEEVSDSDTTI
jgi:hypothetical protein